MKTLYLLALLLLALPADAQTRVLLPLDVVGFAWGPPAAGTPAGYEVEIKRNGRTGPLQVTTAAVEAVLVQLAPADEVTVRVRSVQQVAGQSFRSEWSAWSDTAVRVPPVPSAPTSVAGAALDASSTDRTR